MTRRIAGLALVLALLSWAPCVASDLDPEAAAMLELLRNGDVARQIVAARWLGLHRVNEARGAFYEILMQPAIDRDLAATVGLMVEILSRPHLLRFEDPAAVLAHLDDPDPRTRADAVRHTAYFDLRQAAGRVGDCLDDPDALVREEALIALALLGDAGQRKAALALLDDPEGAVRVRAFEYLHRLDDPQLLDRIVVLAGDESRWIAEPVVRQLAAGPLARESVTALLGAARSCPDPARATRYLGALTRFGAVADWPADSIDTLRGFLGHTDESVRIAAASLLSAVDAGASRKALELGLGSPVAANRLASMRALTAMEARVEPEAVARLLADADPDVRSAAVELAAGLPPRQQRRVWLDVLERDDVPEELLTLVLASFPEVGEPQDAALLLRHAREAPDDFVRMNAANALAGLELKTGTRVGYDWYVQVLGDDGADPAVKRAVAAAIELSGDEAYIPLLADALRHCPAEEPALADALARTISMLLGRKLHGSEFGPGAGR